MSCPVWLTKLLIHTGAARLLPGVRRRLGPGAAYLRYYSDRLLCCPWNSLDSAAAFLDACDPDTIDLAAGTPTLELVPSGTTRLPAGQRGWPPLTGLPELRKAIAGRLLVDHCLAIDPSTEVQITAGATGAIQLALEALVNAGDAVVLFDPCSPLYPFLVRSRRARVRRVDSWNEDGRTRFRLAHMARALRGARLLIVNAPANPTGGVVSPDDLEQIAWWADRYDVLLLNDEVFARFVLDGEAVSVGTLPRARGRTLTVGGMSKSHALPSARVGWLAGCRPLVQACQAMAAFRAALVPTLSQHAALAALEAGPGAADAFVRSLEARRGYVVERLRGLGLNVVWPAGGYFCWLPVWTLGTSGEEFAAGLLRTHKVRVMPGGSFGPEGKGHVRLSFGGDEGRLHEGLNRLTRYVEWIRGTGTAGTAQAA